MREVPEDLLRLIVSFTGSLRGHPKARAGVGNVRDRYVNARAWEERCPYTDEFWMSPKGTYGVFFHIPLFLFGTHTFRPEGFRHGLVDQILQSKFRGEIKG